jgi:predicted protein tyrosine phosphatase
MLKNIVVSSIITCVDDAADFHPDQVISFLDAGHKAPDFGLSSDNHLIFTDVEDTDNNQHAFAPSSSMIQSVIDFVRPDSKLLVHCIGGISRSTATAVALMVIRGASVDDAMNATHQMQPNMWPNHIILTLFDIHIKANGEFVKKCRQIHQDFDHKLQLWCDKCKIHFKDGDNCPKGHW